MKHMILFFAVAVLAAGACYGSDFAYRLTAEVQTSGPQSLDDITWQQGTTPLIQVDPLRRGKAIDADSAMEVRMVIGPSGTGAYYAEATNYLATNTYYLIQWPTIGTNSVGTNGTTDAWWYTIYFQRDGHRYWTGNGRLYIEETTSTAEDGLVWQTVTANTIEWGNIAGDIANQTDVAAYVESLISGTQTVEVAYGTSSTTAYRGDWGAAVSNTADAAYTSATGAAATAASAYTAATQAQATADATAVAIDGKLDSNHWAAADSTTNYLSKTGDTMTGNLRFSNADTSYVPPTVEYYWNAGAPSYGVYSRPYFLGNLSYLVYSNSLTVATNKIWQSGNDGSGSGLDADLLDGKDSTAFATGTPLYVETYLGTGDFHTAIFSGGTTSTYLSGDGSLQDFPASTGGATAGVNQISINGTNYNGDLTFAGDAVSAEGSTITFTQGAGSGGGTSTSDVKAIAFNSGTTPHVITYSLTNGATLTLDRVAGTNTFALTLTNAIVLSIATNSWDATEIGRFSVDVTAGEHALGFDTLAIGGSTVLDISTNTVTPLYFRSPYGTQKWSVRQ